VLVAFVALTAIKSIARSLGFEPAAETPITAAPPPPVNTIPYEPVTAPPRPSAVSPVLLDAGRAPP
jgi:hypothetical protein